MVEPEGNTLLTDTNRILYKWDAWTHKSKASLGCLRLKALKEQSDAAKIMSVFTALQAGGQSVTAEIKLLTRTSCSVNLLFLTRSGSTGSSVRVKQLHHTFHYVQQTQCESCQICSWPRVEVDKGKKKYSTDVEAALSEFPLVFPQAQQQGLEGAAALLILGWCTWRATYFSQE